MQEMLIGILESQIVEGLLVGLIVAVVIALRDRYVMHRLVAELQYTGRAVVNDLTLQVQKNASEYHHFLEDLLRGRERDYRGLSRSQTSDYSESRSYLYPEWGGSFPEAWLFVLKQQDERLQAILGEQDKRLHFFIETQQREALRFFADEHERFHRDEVASAKSSRLLAEELRHVLERQDEQMRFLMERQDENLRLLLSAREEERRAPLETAKALPGVTQQPTSFAIEFDDSISAGRAAEFLTELTRAIHAQGGKICFDTVHGEEG